MVENNDPFSDVDIDFIQNTVTGSLQVLNYLDGIISNSIDYNLSQSIYGNSIEELYETIDAQYYHLDVFIKNPTISPYFSSEQSQSIASALYSASIY